MSLGRFSQRSALPPSATLGSEAKSFQDLGRDCEIFGVLAEGVTRQQRILRILRILRTQRQQRIQRHQRQQRYLRIQRITFSGKGVSGWAMQYRYRNCSERRAGRAEQIGAASGGRFLEGPRRLWRRRRVEWHGSARYIRLRVASTRQAGGGHRDVPTKPT